MFFSSLKIKEVKAREILDSRGDPTVEVKVLLNDGTIGVAGVPSGASTGTHEALELRDGDKTRYNGKGVLRAVNNVNTILNGKLRGMKAVKQVKIDERMIALDGTENKSNLGANAILGVSLAVARAASISLKLPPYRYLREIFNIKFPTYKAPVPLMNIFNGGRHADTNLDFQEYMIIPNYSRKLKERVRVGSEVFHMLAKVLKEKGMDTDIGNEGGYAPIMETNEQPLQLIVEAIKRAGYVAGKDVKIGLDTASSEIYDPKLKKYILRMENKSLDAAGMINLFKDWTNRYPIATLEDGLSEDDWAGWQALTKELGKKVQIIGDDLFVTDIKRLEQGIKSGAANAILIKPNQVGSLTETMYAVYNAKNNNYKVVISHRSGETVDDFIADLAIAVNADYTKFGSLCRGERVAKYNRLMEIEDEISK